MIDPTKLARSAFLALALLFLAPLTGLGGSLLGVEAAQAATVSKISVAGNVQVDDNTTVKYLALGVGDTITSAKLDASVAALLGDGPVQDRQRDIVGLDRRSEGQRELDRGFGAVRRQYALHRRQSRRDDRYDQPRHGRRGWASPATSQSIIKAYRTSATPT